MPRKGYVNGHVTSLIFVPHDAMLAQHMLSSCVRLSVCHKPALNHDG